MAYKVHLELGLRLPHFSSSLVIRFELVLLTFELTCSFTGVFAASAEEY